MLAADKLQLQSALKQQATALKEKEFNLHHSNFMTVGTQAAVLAALDVTMFIEFTPPDDSTWAEPYRWLCWIIKCCYYTVIVSAFCANMIVVSQTTALSVLGAGLALRGPDGSMMTATEGLYEERSSVFKTFGIGLALTVGSVLLSVWLILHWENAAVCWCVAAWTMRRIFKDYRRVAKRFDYDESDTVDFSDILLGPAAIRAVPAVVNQVLLGRSKSDQELLVSGRKKTTGTSSQQQLTMMQRAASGFGWGRRQPSVDETNAEDEEDGDDNDNDDEDIEQQQQQQDLIQKSRGPKQSMKQRRKGTDGSLSSP